jgi:UDP-N-acetylmuramate dehydrogenase
MIRTYLKNTPPAIVARCRKAEAQGRKRTRGYDDSRGNKGIAAPGPIPTGWSSFEIGSRKFRENVSLAKFTNYKIGGPARFFFEAKTETDIQWAIREVKSRRLPCFVLGGGTNILMDDAGFDGLVLKINIGGISAKGNLITAGAGISMDKLTAFAAKNSLGGLNWAGGLPGTLGGAIRGNAGCFGGEMKDNIKMVRSFNTKTMRLVTRSALQCRFGYRTSIFKQRPGEIILRATFHMKKRIQKEISAALRKEKMWRAAHHPLEHPSAGSVFKNVPLSRILQPRSKQYRDAVKSLAARYRGSSFSVKTDPVPVIAAAKLIGESGLTGTRRGGAMISPKHTNFIVNTGNATASDVLALMALAKEQVYRKFGIRLEPEIQIVASPKSRLRVKMRKKELPTS